MTGLQLNVTLFCPPVALKFVGIGGKGKALNSLERSYVPEELAETIL